MQNPNQDPDCDDIPADKCVCEMTADEFDRFAAENEPELVADARYHVAAARMDEGAHEMALLHALDATGTGYIDIAAMSWSVVAAAYQALGQIGSACDAASRASALADQTGDLELIAFTTDNLGRIYASFDPTFAADRFTRSAAIYEAADDPVNTVRTGTAAAYNNLLGGHPHEAVAQAERSLNLAEERFVDLPYERRIALSVAALGHQSLGQYKQAARYMNRSNSNWWNRLKLRAQILWHNQPTDPTQ